MSENPKVSVIIPTHNHSHFLPECLASIKAQTYKDYEVIVVNNGSTDNTEEVVSKLAWNQLRYHYQIDTGSVAGSRNTGIGLARGKYVAFLDSDDIWYERKLEKIMDVFEEMPEIDIISHDLFLIRGGKNRGLLKTGPVRKDMFNALLIKNCLLGSATVVKKAVMDQIGGFNPNKEFVHVEDYEAWLRIALLGKKFYFLNEGLGEYRAHEVNLSFDFENVLLHEKNVIDKHFKNLSNGNSLSHFLSYNRRLSVIYSKMCMQYCFRKKFGCGMLNFSRSFLLNPINSVGNLFALLRGKWI